MSLYYSSPEKFRGFVSFRSVFVTIFIFKCLMSTVSGQSTGGGILFPQDSETREKKSLDGVWNFRIAPRNDPDLGFREEWYSQPLAETGAVDLMPVPSSYNDVTQSKLIREHVGWAFYDREFFIPKDWMSNTRIWLRFGSVNYHAIVWVNGIRVTEHSGGHLPFQTELSSTDLSAQSPNRVTVAVNNTLSPTTIPQGRVVHQTGTRFPPGYFTLDYNFDFFNYAGIHRPVYLYTTPVTFIEDVSVTSNVIGTTGSVSYNVVPSSAAHKEIKLHHENDILTKYGEDLRQNAVFYDVSLEDKRGNVVSRQSTAQGVLSVPTAKLWWPFSMVANDSDAGYLYTLVVRLTNNAQEEVDVYRLKVGIRTITWTSNSFLINNKPFYFRGFGRHEDFDVRGRGVDPVMLVKDHNLVKWTGANSYRTSHYPYSEEIMDITDELGIVIIDEISAVAIDGFGPELLAVHKQQMTDLIKRDKNRASVVMWSISNEPQSQKAEAGPYFKDVVELAKSLDSTRPISIVLNQQYNQDKEVADITRSLDATRPVSIVVAQEYDREQAAEYVDIIGINRYYAWYSDTGHTEVITKSVVQDVHNWINKFNKPLLITEYGADTVAGLHRSPDFVFTEEYQMEYMKQHFIAFDELRQNSSFIGEMIWNFADFMTGQGITRIVGNRKGVFTRDRQPKSSAHLLRTRYHLLAQESDNYPRPDDLLHTPPVYSAPPRHHEL